MIGDSGSSSSARLTSAIASDTRPTVARYIAYWLCASADAGFSAIPCSNSRRRPASPSRASSLMCPSATCASASDGSSFSACSAAAFASVIASTQYDPSSR